MPRNRRRALRHEIVCRVDYADRQGRAWLGLIRDLSAEGVFIEYTPALTVGDIVVTTFTLPGRSPCKLQAEVVHVTASGAGLKFVGCSEDETAHQPDSLEAYCAALYEAWLARTWSARRRATRTA